MKLFAKKDRRTGLEKEIDSVVDHMSQVPDVLSDNYGKLIDRLEKLTEIDSRIKTRKDKSEKLSPNTILVVTGGIVEIILIMTYERTHVIATKAFSRLLRGRA